MKPSRERRTRKDEKGAGVYDLAKKSCPGYMSEKETNTCFCNLISLLGLSHLMYHEKLMEKSGMN